VSEEPASGDDVGPVEASEAALALLRSSADAMIDPQVLFEAVRDSDGRVVDFRYRSANRAALSYLGLDETELIGRSARTSLPNFEGSGLLGRYAQCLSDGQPVILDDFKYLSGTLRDEQTRGELLVDGRRYDIRATKAGFISDLLRNKQDESVVKAIVGIAKEFGLLTVAEGVEDAETRTRLVELGVDQLQGYLIGAPAPVGTTSVAVDN